jgi:hypothetical protein
VIKDYVTRLEITMENSARVREGYGSADCGEDGNIDPRSLDQAGYLPSNGGSFHQPHAEVVAPVMFANLVDRTMFG